MLCGKALEGAANSEEAAVNMILSWFVFLGSVFLFRYNFDYLQKDLIKAMADYYQEIYLCVFKFIITFVIGTNNTKKHGTGTRQKMEV